MDMEGVRRRSSFAAAAATLLLFLTLAVLTASAIGGDEAAAAAAEQSQHCHPHPNPPLAADEPYALIVFQNTKDGEEIRLLADQRPSVPRAGYSYANRSGNWFYSIRARDEDGKSSKRRLLHPQPSASTTAAEGLWHTLGTLANTTAAAAADGEGDEHYYMVVGLQTSGGDKIRLLVVADDRQRYMFITGFARGFLIRPRWFFREGELLPLPLPSLGGSGSSSRSSHAEVVASSLLAALKNMSEEDS